MKESVFAAIELPNWASVHRLTDPTFTSEMEKPQQRCNVFVLATV